MRRRVSLIVLALLCSGLGVSLYPGPCPVQQAPCEGMLRADTVQRLPQRTVFLARGLTDEELISFSANLAAGAHPGVLLLDAPKVRPYTKHFLNAYRPDQVIRVGSSSDTQEEMQRQLGTSITGGLGWALSPHNTLRQALFAQPEQIVVCRAEPRRLLLHAACLAGAARAPLYVLHGEDDAVEFRRQVAAWRARKVLAITAAADACRDLPEVEVVALADEQAVTDFYLALQTKKGPIQTLVVANPADPREGRVSMSALAPWVALQRRAALLLTNARGDDAGALGRAALKKKALRKAENLILVADLQAVPMERRPNPLPGADEMIDLEPPGPTGADPFTLATGRLFHQQPAVVTLMLARQLLLAEAKGPRRALVVSNPGGGLPLLETISRHSAKEFRNAGYQTTTLFNSDSRKEEVHRLLPQQDIFLWEGHHSTLVSDYGVPTWPEPLRPSLVFLQSCLALAEPQAAPFLEHGAVGVIGSPSRTYSASGGAFTLAYFDAMFYDGQSVGGSLRQAKNFLLSYAKLKEKRLGEAAKLGGANVRSAWAFTLWGDPTVKLPPPEAPKGGLTPVKAEALTRRITLSLPKESYGKVDTEAYKAEMLPNSRLAGLITKKGQEDEKHLVPMLFAEVHLKAPVGKRPVLRSRLPGANWVFLWDQRRHNGYLLIRPRASDREEIRFQVTWED